MNKNSISDIFINEYIDLFLRLTKSPEINIAFQKLSDTESFCKQLLEQITLLYFFQGTPVLAPNTLRTEFNKCVTCNQNFYSKFLQPLIFNTITTKIPDEFFTTQQNTDIHIPNNVFSTDNGTAGILDIFDKYIFTLCDTMPSNNKNVISPEILGTIFERLLSTQSKKSHGTVYTPPKIVHLICCECLTYFLQTKFSHDIPASEIASFIHNGTTTPRIKKHAKKINDALAQILIFDPAIGSGAFPIGMMHTITQARLKLDNDRKNLHAYKLHFIQHCLHGTDIAPHALQNTKLRLWLSLISDDKVPPLHSLKFNLLCTNPLLDTISNTTKFDIIIGNPPYVGEKSNKEQFQQIKEHSLGKFYQGKMDLFYFFFHLGLNLARPSGIVAFITTNYYITANGAYNLRTDIKNRANILSLINFNELRIFDTAHGQHNMITILQKQDGTSPVPKCKYCYTERTGIATPDIIQDIILERDCKTIYSTIPQQNLYSNSENYIRTTNNAPTITQKIKTNSDMLGNVFNVNQGIISGADKISDKHLREYQLNATKNEGIYVLDETNDNDAIILSQIRASNEDDILRPFFKNSDIKQFSTATHSTKHIIYANKNNYDLTKYPTIDAHLNRFRALLDNATDNSPYLHRPRNDAIFTGPKIIAPQRSSINTFGYNDTPWYSSADVYYITPKTPNNPKYDLKYVLGLLNSRLYYFWLYNYGKRKGNSLELYQTPLSQTPIKSGTASQIAAVIALVDKMISATTISQSDTDKLNHLIYKIYNLTDAEQEYLNKNYN